MTGYEAFSIFHVLKLHFTTNYDYFKYNGKCNINIETFEKRKDKYHFYKLSRKYDEDTFREFVISNLIKDCNIWVGKLLEENSSQIHFDRMSRIQSLSYRFKNDCAEIKNEGNLNQVLRTDGDYPTLLTLATQNVVCDETICILNSLVNFLPIWSRKIKDTIRWPLLYSKWMCYSPFLNYDKEKFRKYAIEELK